MTTLKRLFGDGFRVFFLAAGLFACLSVAIWAGWLAIGALGGGLNWPTAAAPHLWHAHEMIFGYGAAVLGGFFLTAVPNWTGAKAARHLFIATVAGLWLAGRLAVSSATTNSTNGQARIIRRLMAVLKGSTSAAIRASCIE